MFFVVFFSTLHFNLGIDIAVRLARQYTLPRNIYINKLLGESKVIRSNTIFAQFNYWKNVEREKKYWTVVGLSLDGVVAFILKNHSFCSSRLTMVIYYAHITLTACAFRWLISNDVRKVFYFLLSRYFIK